MSGIHVWEVHVSHTTAVDMGGKQQTYRTNTTRWVVTTTAERVLTLATAGLADAEVIQVIRRSASERTVIDPECRS